MVEQKRIMNLISSLSKPSQHPVKEPPLHFSLL